MWMPERFDSWKVGVRLCDALNVLDALPATLCAWLAGVWEELVFVPDLPALAMAPMMIMAAKRAARKGAKKARAIILLQRGQFPSNVYLRV